MRERVSDLADPRLRVYRNLRDKDLAREEEAFVAEGLEVVGHLVRSRWSVRSVLLAESRWARLEPHLADLGPEVPVFVATLEQMSSVVGFPIHRGVLACGDRRSPPFALPPCGPVSVLGLAGLANHDNVGSAFRNAAAFGVHAVALGGAADPLYRKSLRVSMGHALRVPFFETERPEALVERLRQSDLQVWGASPRAGGLEAETLAPGQIPERIALLIGEEGAGLSDRVLAECDETIRIRMAAGTDSLNAATAAAVLLHVLRSGCPQAFGSSTSAPRRGR